MDIIFDIETNNLLAALDRVHCLVLRDADTGNLLMSCTDAISPSAPGSHHPIRDGLEALEGPGLRIGHNSLNFDHPALTKVYGVPVPPIGQIRDTYLLGRVLWPEIKEGDMGRWKAGKFPGNLIGRHSLEAWGHLTPSNPGNPRDSLRTPHNPLHHLAAPPLPPSPHRPQRLPQRPCDHAAPDNDMALRSP